MSLLAHTSRVTFEISDRCNLAYAHIACPAHAMRNEPPIFLPIRLIHGVLDFLHDEGFAGQLAWHNYNDPMCDPRLLWLIDLAAVHVPDAGQYILTNGLNLNQGMLDLLVSHGITRLWVSAYTDAEEKRTKALKAPGIDYKVRRFVKLDNRLTIYDRPESGDQRPCYEPLENLLIRADGRVGLCCVDWAQTVNYGSLYEKSLKEILESAEIRDDWQRHTEGKRRHAICKRCRGPRGRQSAPAE